MVVMRFKPHQALAKFVKCYYYLENDTSAIVRDTYFADGCVEAVFSTGWEFYRDGNKEDWAKVIGQIIQPRTLTIAGSGLSFGIWFYPHTFSCFTKISVNELNDRVISWDLLFSKSFAEFVGDSLSKRRFKELISGVDNYLLKKKQGNNDSRDKLAEAAVQYLYTHKATSCLDELAVSLNVSQRYLQKIFLAKVGFSQKFLLRILRFQEAVRTIGQDSTSGFARMAYENDFSDQSHFIREFKSFTGMVPSEFEKQKLPINQHFLAE